MARISELEKLFGLQLLAYRLNDGCEREYKFCEDRKFRFDFCWPAQKIAVELQGGIWGRKSGHNSGTGILADMDKGNEAARRGCRVFRFSGDHVKCGEAVRYIEARLRDCGKIEI